MGTFLRLNGLGNKYILILINGQKLSGDISNNVDLTRINMSRVKRIEVLDGAASSLYGSDAIAGVINIITDQPSSQLISVTSDTRVSGKGQLTESVNVDFYHKGLGSYTTLTHDRANSYQNNNLQYIKGSDTETQETIAPYYTGYRANMLSQKFTYEPMRQLAFNAGIDMSYKKTDRPDTDPYITGGTDYEMRYKGLRWNIGGIYKFSRKNSLQTSFSVDRYRYGKEYDVETKTYNIGDYVQSKKQRTMEGEMKAILCLYQNSTTIIGANWRKDFLKATSGNIDESLYTLAGYMQHEILLLENITATAGLRFTHNETFGNHITPKFTVMYAPGNIRFRATYSAGFRTPGLDELFYHYFSVNRGKAQIIFGNKDLSPEKSHYFSLNAEYHSNQYYFGVTAFYNCINDMIVRKDIEVDAQSLNILQKEFPEMTADQSALLERYSLYQNSDRGDVKGLQINASANFMKDFSLSANYACIYARSQTAGVWSVLDRSIRNTATVALNYHHAWNHYGLNINLNGRFQSKTYYQAYEDAPGYGIFNIQTTHSLDYWKWMLIEPSFGIENILDKVDRRIDSSKRKYALYSPGRMITIGLKIRFKG